MNASVWPSDARLEIKISRYHCVGERRIENRPVFLYDVTPGDPTSPVGLRCVITEDLIVTQTAMSREISSQIQIPCPHL